MAEGVATGGAGTNMRKEINIKSNDRKMMMEPNAKDSLYDKNEAGVEYEVKGGVGHKDNLGGENTRT
jgi:hypothetical protein